MIKIEKKEKYIENRYIAITRSSISTRAWPSSLVYNNSNNAVTDKPYSKYTIYDFPVDENGLTLDPIRLTELGYYVIIGISHEYYVAARNGYSIGKDFKSAIDAWRCCAEDCVKKNLLKQLPQQGEII